MRLAMSALLLSSVFLLSAPVRTDHPPCLHSQEVSELKSAANSIERLNLLRIYSRITVARLVFEVATYRPMQEQGEVYSVPAEFPHPDWEESQQRYLKTWRAVKSSYWCLMVTSIHEVRELEDVQGEARCILEDMHSETLSFVPRIRKARENVEVHKELHRKVDSAIETTEDLAAEIRDALDREAHPATTG